MRACESLSHPATVSKISKIVVEEAEHFASSLPRKITQEDLLQLMTILPGEDACRPTVSEASWFTTGGYAHGGGIAGLRQTFFPHFTSVLCRFTRRILSTQVYRLDVGYEPDHSNAPDSFSEPCSKQQECCDSA